MKNHFLTSKKMTVKKLIMFLLIISSLNTSAQVIAGKVERVSGDTVMVLGYRFIVPGNTLKVGDSATFTPTNNSYRKTRRKVNSKAGDTVIAKN